jgi:glycosyltransferase involved in cell wall biosynthesis
MHLGILTSHPIQYQAPWFRALAKETELEVFFAHRPDAAQQGDGFGKAFSWDVDLLSGYRHRFLENVAKRPSSSRFFGCDTPEIKEIICGKQKAESRKQKAEVTGQRSVVSGQSSVLQRRFDAFIVNGWHLKSYWQAVRACRHARIAVLVRGDSQLLTPRSRLKRMAKSIAYRLLLRQFDGFLAVGRRNREYLEHYAVPSGKIFFAPHFVDNEWFRNKAEIFRKQKTGIRKEWQIPEDAFCVLFCGKFIPKKRPMDLVEAAHLLMRDNRIPNLHLLFVGSGQLGTQLRANCDVVFDAEAFVSSARRSIPGPRPKAVFAGFRNQSQLPAAYMASDVLVLPSDAGETWGLVVNEAMACSLPAIVSNAVGCAPDLIDEGKTGFTYPMDDKGALAERLAALAKMNFAGHDFAPALAEKMRAYSLQNAVSGTLHALRRSVLNSQQSLDCGR